MATFVIDKAEPSQKLTVSSLLLSQIHPSLITSSWESRRTGFANLFICLTSTSNSGEKVSVHKQREEIPIIHRERKFPANQEI